MKYKLSLLSIFFVCLAVLFTIPVFADTPIIDSYVASDISPVAGQTVTFAWSANNPDGGPIYYRWVHDWMLVHPGDAWDYIGTDNSYSFTFDSIGPYLTALEACDNPAFDYPYAIAWETVTVGNNPPVAEANGPYYGDEASPFAANSPITLNAFGSYDPDGDTLTYEWDIDSDGIYDYTGEQVDAEFPDNGEYTITLKVTDEHGETAFDTTTASIANVPPYVVLSVNGNSTDNPVTVTAGEDNVIHAEVYDAPGDLTGVHYYWAWNSSGGGPYDTDGIDLSTVNHIYELGNYTLAVKTIDKDGGYSWSYSIDYRWINAVEGANNPPVAVAGPDQTVDEGTTVNFDGTGSSDPDTGDTLTYHWDFGDGSTGSGATPDHVYNYGTYTATLTVTDSHGATDTDALTVTVNNISPQIIKITQNGLDPEYPPVYVGEPVTYKVYYTAPITDTITFDWDFDWMVHQGNGKEIIDGTSDTEVFTYTHTYTGSPFVVCWVKDDDGSAPFLFYYVTVLEQPTNNSPVADAGGPYVINVGDDLYLDGSGSTDPDTGDSIASYEWDLNNDSVTDVTGATPTVGWADLVTLTVGEPGTFPVRLKVTDGHGLTATQDTTLTVYPNLPTAVIEATPNPANVGQSVTFSGSSSYHGDPRRTIVSHQWDLNNDGIFETPGMVVSHSFDTPGNHTVGLKVTDDTGDYGTETAVIQVIQPNRPPEADAGGPYEINPGETLVLDGSNSTDPDAGDYITLYNWDLNNDGTYDFSGDLAIATWEELQSLGVSQFGEHRVSLTVTDKHGLTNTGMTSVWIYDPVPTASFTASPNPAAPTQSITFDARSSVSNDPRADITYYEWDFDNNGTVDSYYPVASHTYNKFGSFTAKLRIATGSGYQDTETMVIDVSEGNHAPTAVHGGPYQINAGDSLSLNGSGSWDSDTVYGDSIVSYEWDLTNDNVTDVTGATPTLSWAQLDALGVALPGNISSVMLRVTDSFGASTSAYTTLLIIFPNNPPVADAGGPYNTTESIQIFLDGSASSDPDIGDSIVKYEWDLDNDGTFEIENNANPPFSKPDDGTYPVTLRVTDSHGETDTDTVNVLVTNTDPVVDIPPPAPVDEGTQLALTAYFFEAGGWDYHTAVIDWGDGTQSNGTVTEVLDGRPFGGSVSGSHTYAVCGTYTVTVTVTDKDGGTGSDTKTITVNHVNHDPTAVTGGPYEINVGENLQLDASGSTDPDSVCGDSITKYEWFLNNDGAEDEPEKEGVSPSVTPAELDSYGIAGPDEYTIKLKVTDSFGATNTAATTLAVNANDITAPQTTLILDPPAPDGKNGWYKTPPLISFSTGEDGTTTCYKWKEPDPWTDWDGVVFYAPEGPNWLYYFSLDSSNNKELNQKIQIKVDKTPPKSKGIYSSSNVNIRQNAVYTFSWNISENFPNKGKVKLTIKIKRSGKTYRTILNRSWQLLRAGKRYRMNLPRGRYTYNVVAEDQARNTSNIIKKYFTIK